MVAGSNPACPTTLQRKTTMTLSTPPLCDFGTPAVPFDLPGTDGRHWSLQECTGKTGLLLMFICNHCPYVSAIHRRIVRDSKKLKLLGINTVAISSNDAEQYPEDSFDNMKKLTKDLEIDFPYLLDEEQAIARLYGAICTPDFFGYNHKLELQYRGRLDASDHRPGPLDATPELFNAMKEISITGKGPKKQISSRGCSIKWKKDL